MNRRHSPLHPGHGDSRTGAKTSSPGNVVAPDDVIARYGADATGMYALFAAPLDLDLDRQEDGVAGVSRFLGPGPSPGYALPRAGPQPRWAHPPAAPTSSSGAGAAAQAAPDHTARSLRTSPDAGTSTPHIAAVMEPVNSIIAAEPGLAERPAAVSARIDGHHRAVLDPLAGALRTYLAAELWQ